MGIQMILQTITEAVVFWLKFWVYIVTGLMVGLALSAVIYIAHDLPNYVRKRFKNKSKEGKQ